MAKANFYLGRVYDIDAGDTTAEKLQYDADDLTTHGVIVGMTGSGKTGLCLDLMEEAALNNVPAIMIDPKGDITNALLHFPGLLPDDFKPWIDASKAQRSGKTLNEVATDTANLWKNGLAGWDIDSDRIQRLKDSAQFSIYTPGSDAGLKVSILATLRAPELGWTGNEEALREQIGSTVTALLGLIGKNDIDPVQDREHILLANIFEHAWSQGKDLTLSELIMQTMSPPFEKLGVFDIGMFFPDKDRSKLAMELNNILAAPSFQAWIEGEPLDIQNMLFMPDGSARHTIFYISHLNDAERMFFVTLLYGAVESWMRAQSGSGSLRALVYFDEIFGYLPPTSNPPSKEPMLRLLKQARAFGVGMVLATQNPVDIDYKALSNAGTWFIGKLGTEQDKQRLLDGLESATGAGVSRKEYDRMISGMGKRVFLLRNVHEKQPVLFQTRWAMNYLAGPITRNRIGELNEMAGARAAEPIVEQAVLRERGDDGRQTTDHSLSASPSVVRGRSSVVSSPPPPVDPMESIGTSTRPKVPGRTQEFFLPQTMSLRESAETSRREWAVDLPHVGTVYRPVLLAQADIRLVNRKYGLNESVIRSVVVSDPDDRGMVQWEDFELSDAIDGRSMDRSPDGDARFGELEAPFSDSRSMTALKSDFQEWAFRESQVQIRANEQLKVFGPPEMTDDEFRDACVKAAQKLMDAEVKKVDDSYEKKLDSLGVKLRREERELEEDRADLASRKRAESVGMLETAAGMFGFGRKKSFSGNMSKRRMTSKAKADVEESEDEIERLERDIQAMEREAEDELDAIKQKWEAVIDEVTEIPVNPFKKNVIIDLFGVAWMPHYVVEDNGRMLELAAYAPG